MIQKTRTVRPSGFTLVELLVVLVIITVLISILVPTFMKVRESSRRTVCQSNLRQLSAAWTNFATERGGTMVSGGSAADPNGDLFPYIKNTKAYVCPSDPREDLHLTYAINSCLNDAGHSLFPVTLRNVSAVPQPSRTLLFIEVGGASSRRSFTQIPGPPAAWFDLPCYWHNGTCLSFVDGHADFLKWLDPRTNEIGRGPPNYGSPNAQPQPDNPDLQALLAMMLPR
jgi:prepilin-type N-terminal cleavage/methylation domain-containing protein